MSLTGYGQKNAYNFHKLGFQQGLHDGIIRCIHQDQYGYIWVGSVGGVNKYNGRNFQRYLHVQGDSLSPLGTQPRAMHSDKKGRFWIGFENGLMQFDFKKEKFIANPHFKNLFIRSICSASENLLFVATNKGLYKLDVEKNTVLAYGNSNQEKHRALNQTRVYDLLHKEGVLYIGSENGFLTLDVKSDVCSEGIYGVNLDGQVASLAVDQQNNIWFCVYGNIKLGKIRYKERDIVSYDHIMDMGNDEQPFHVVACVADQKNRIWAATAKEGLMQYDSVANTFIKIKHKEHIPSSPSGNAYRCMFMDRSGLIWLGLDVEGVNYFDPDKNLFTTILPFPVNTGQQLSKVGRAVDTDHMGNFWFGNHDGVSCYNPENGTYKVYRNEVNKAKVLYTNHVRSMHCDEENNVWIGTSNGVNKFNPRTGQMEFIDSILLPRSFYNSINGDKSGNVWFCTNDSVSLYWYNLKEKKFGHILQHPQLKKYAGYSSVSYVMEDSKNRLWISTTRKGVVVFDKKSKTLQHFTAADTSEYRLSGDLIIDIKEDKSGFVWLSSFTGITALNLDKKIIRKYTNQNGLPGNMSGPLVIDNENRVWAGVNGGLTLIENEGQKIKTFTEVDGLASVGFPEHAGIKSKTGQIILGSNSGFIYFNPKVNVQHSNTFPFYIRSCKIQDKFTKNFSAENGNVTIHLRPDENSFVFEFEALNFSNPQRTQFAYFLEGFDQHWHYTREPQAVFTNVPGGNYTLFMKSSDTDGNWNNITPKSVKIELQTIYYKTTFFKIVSAGFLLFLFFLFYQYRRKQQRQLYDLRNKAQMLEKEKATAMFENLKQQLNPHFLFNSLTSLSGLIELDQTSASRFLNQMSVIYRYILKNADAEAVTLKEELDFVNMYVDLQKTRFNEGLQVSIQIPPEYHNNKVAPVTLQNLIENAIKHNVIAKNRPLKIDIYIENHQYIVVENNLQKKAVVETSNQRGLKQFTSLYRFLSDLPIVIEDDKEDVFRIKIPLL